MKNERPINCVWTGSAFQPQAPADARLAALRYGAGEVITLAEWHDRSKASHDHFFALLGDLWATLPEHQAIRWPTPDALRYEALCRKGFCDVSTFFASSNAEAQRMAGFIREPGIIVTIEGRAVTKLKPHSQSKREMGARRFQESKDAVLAFVAELLEVDLDVVKQVAA